MVEGLVGHAIDVVIPIVGHAALGYAQLTILRVWVTQAALQQVHSLSWRV